MVCLGNICRSPIAEGLLQQKVNETGLDVVVDSCGTGGWHSGENPDPRSISKMLEKGYHIDHQRSRKIHNDDFSEFDRIYCMDQSNLEDVMRLAKTLNANHKVDLILNNKTYGREFEVPDPYYGAADGFELVFQMLDKATDQIIEELKANSII